MIEVPPAEQLGGALLRALLVACLSGVLAVPVTAAWRRSRGWSRRLLGLVLGAPVVMPWLVSVFGILRWLPELARSPLQLELLLVAAWTARVVPAVVAVRCLAPPSPWSPKARFLAASVGFRMGLGQRLRCALGSSAARGAALVFVWVFSGFAAESLLKRPGWSPWVFERLALQVAPGGLLLGTAVLVVPLLLPPLWLLFGGVFQRRGAGVVGSGDGGGPAAAPSPRRASAWLGWLLAVAGVVLVPGVALAMTLYQGLPAMAAASGRAGLGWQLLATLLAGGGGGLLAWWAAALARGFWRKGGQRSFLRPLRWCAVAAVLPGLAGPVVVATGVFAMVAALPRWLGDSPLPLLLALAWLALPAALVLRLAVVRGDLVQAQATAPPVMRFHLRGRRALWAVLFLSVWNAFEVAATAVLAPLGREPLSVFLFNQMHYGATPALAATITLAVVVTAAFACGVAWLAERSLGVRVRPGAGDGVLGDGGPS